MMMDDPRDLQLLAFILKKMLLKQLPFSTRQTSMDENLTSDTTGSIGTLVPNINQNMVKSKAKRHLNQKLVRAQAIRLITKQQVQRTYHRVFREEPNQPSRDPEPSAIRF
jgi:hypothetical protein